MAFYFKKKIKHPVFFSSTKQNFKIIFSKLVVTDSKRKGGGGKIGGIGGEKQQSK